MARLPKNFHLQYKSLYNLHLKKHHNLQILGISELLSLLKPQIMFLAISGISTNLNLNSHNHNNNLYNRHQLHNNFNNLEIRLILLKKHNNLKLLLLNKVIILIKFIEPPKPKIQETNLIDFMDDTPVQP